MGTLGSLCHLLQRVNLPWPAIQNGCTTAKKLGFDPASERDFARFFHSKLKKHP